MANPFGPLGENVGSVHHHITQLSDLDGQLQQQQNDLYDSLNQADNIWETLRAKQHAGARIAQHADDLNQAVDDLRSKVKEQDATIKTLKKEHSSLMDSLHQYGSAIEDMHAEQRQLKSVIDERIKLMAHELKKKDKRRQRSKSPRRHV